MFSEAQCCVRQMGGGGGGGGASLRSADGHTSASTEAVVSLVVNQPYFVGNTSAPLHRGQECYDVDDVKNATALPVCNLREQV